MANDNPLTIQRIFKTWWPLAASWMLMGAEMPVISAVVARLAYPEVNLAAYGGIVFPLALIIESPIIMLLAASTALSKDWRSYEKLRRYMMLMGATLTGLHILVAFTPIYYLVVHKIIGAPQEIIEPARIGLMIMFPWTWAIAFRRFNQGVLIRFGHAHTVTIGTIIRLVADVVMLASGYWLSNFSGIVIATGAVAAGVVSEALYVGLAVRPILKGELRQAKPVATQITLRSFLVFYIPLALTSLLFLLAQPIGSAALSRMPQALASLAVWPVVSGLIFMFRSLGVAYNEVVVALLDEPGSPAGLRRFAVWLSVASSGILLILAGTPLAGIWFERITALSPELAYLAKMGLWLALPMPFLAVWQSWYQGAIVYGQRTRGISEAVLVFLFTIGLLAVAGVAWGGATGLYIGLAIMSLSMAAQTIWLWNRSRPVIAMLHQRQREPLASEIPSGVAD